MSGFAVSCFLTAGVSCAFGGFVYFKNPGNKLNSLWAGFCLAVGIWSLGLGMMVEARDLAWARWALTLHYAGTIFIPVVFLQFVLALLDVARPRVVWGAYAFSALLQVLNMTGHLARPVPTPPFKFYTQPGPFYFLFILLLFSALGYSGMVLHQRYGLLGGAKRTQVKLFGMGLTCGFAGGLTTLFPVFRWSVPPFGMYFVALYVVIVGIAILRYRFLDIHTVVHKTAMWVVTSMLFVVPVGLGFSLGQGWIAQLSPWRFGLLFSILSFLLIPYLRIVQPRIDHLFQRRQYNVQRLLQGLVQELAALKNIDSLVQRMVETIREALYATGITIILWDRRSATFKVVNTTSVGGPRVLDRDESFLQWLRSVDCVISLDGEQVGSEPIAIRQAIQAYVGAFNARIALPLTHEGQLIGAISLGEKENLSQYSRQDFDFLTTLRAEAAIAMSNSILYDDVKGLSAELKVWAVDLEKKVEERTREVEESKRELEGSYQKLQELDQAKSQFFANISHELRTPLTLILAPMESLFKGESGPLSDVHRRHLEIMHQNGLRLLKQINSLLDLAKLDAGRMQLHSRGGDLAAFFRGLVASITPLAEKKHVSLIGQEDTSLPSQAYFDHDQLEKAVLNLVFNALKFTPSGGRIELRWGLSSGGEIRVQIVDTGIGIASDDLPKLFKRFSQVDAATNRRYEGTGIGLALAKEIVELHGGRIEVASEVGRGTTMTVVIPLILERPENTVDTVVNDGTAQADDWTRELHAAAERQQLTEGSTESQVLTAEGLSPANGVQILVVEDNHDMREFIAFQLQGDYRVLKASNGVEGLRMAAEALPDLIVSDVMMPEKDGYQLCREIRADAKTMHIPIILLTARADMAMKIEGLEHGADDYLTKPFNAQELRAKIKSLLALRQLEREIQQRNEALEAALAELKATQSQLVQSEKMAGLGLLVAGMAHEINNPINFAKNSLTILERAWGELKPLLAHDTARRETIEDLDASVGIVKTGVQRTEQIVTQLKVFARKDQGMAVRCPVQEGLESTLRLIRPTLEPGVVLRTDFQANGWISVIPGQLNQVWMNLLQNAIQAVGSSGEVWVASRDHEHVVSVSVRDTGSGIKSEHISKLFEPFFTTKPVGQGTGLGLSVSYQIIQDAGGRIEVKSEEGHGAEFTVFLPRVAALERIA